MIEWFGVGGMALAGLSIALIWRTLRGRSGSLLQSTELRAYVVLLVAASIWAASVASRELQQEDPSQVVVDEVAGQFVTLMLTGSAIRGAILGFLIFRVLDIIKPWPAQKIERFHGGVGIVGDDVAVAIYGNLILQGVFYFVPDFR